MQVHKAAKAMPEMPKAELDALVADIKANGLLVPIELYGGKIIDGRHRYKACRMAKVDPDFVDVDLKGQAPEQYVWSLNGARRHLTASQRAAVAVELLPAIEETAKERQKLSKGRGQKGPAKLPDLKDARDEAAAMVGVSGKYVSDAKKVKAESPELLKKVRDGELTLPQAKQEIKQEEKRKEQKAKAKAIRESPKKETTWSLRHGDCLRVLGGISDARLVFADPPYNIGIDYGSGSDADAMTASAYLEWCRQWLGSCADCLTDDGSIWVMINDEWVEHFAIILNELGLTRRSWIKWYETFGVNCSRNFNRTSRHILYYVVDPKHFVFNAIAVTRKSDRQTKYKDRRAQPGGKIWDDVWQIPRLTGNSKERMPDYPTQLPLALLKPIVECASDPGDLVVDPFAGSGTTGVASKAADRRFIGVEKEEKFWEAAKVRIATS